MAKCELNLKSSTVFEPQIPTNILVGLSPPIYEDFVMIHSVAIFRMTLQHVEVRIN
jgi:hypothetical protein